MDLREIRSTLIGQYADPDMWRRLEKRVRAEIDRKAEEMADGRLPDYAKYREAVGYLNALGWVMTQAKEVSGQDDPRMDRE